MAKNVSLIILERVIIIIEVIYKKRLRSYVGRPMLRTPVSVRACVGVGKVTVPKSRDEIY